MANFGIDDIVDQTLFMPVCDLLKMESAIELEEVLFHQILQLDHHLLPMDDYIQWYAKLDKWSDNLSHIIHSFRAAQMSVTKRRVNADMADSDLAIDG
jgi:hypothetical protein